MATEVVTYQIIRNMACIVCGAIFNAPRAGKLYCSPRCKQFAYYHQDEIEALQQAKNLGQISAVQLSLREFEAYIAALDLLCEYSNLKKKQASSYRPFEPSDALRLKILLKQIPRYLQNLDPPYMTIEEWSFIKLLYPSLKKEDFIKLICSLDSKFFENLTYADPPTKDKLKQNPIKSLYQNHVLKIAEGKIKFI